MTKQNAHTIQTPYGPVYLMATGQDEVRFETYRGDNHDEDKPLVINRVAYRLWARLWVLPTGSLDRCRTLPGGYPQYNEGYRLERNNLFDDTPVSDSARNKFSKEVLPLLEQFVMEHPEILHEAEIVKREAMKDGRLSEIRSHYEKIKKLENEIHLLSQNIAAFKAGDVPPTLEPPRCSDCFSPLDRRNSRPYTDDPTDPPRFSFYCPGCRKESVMPLL